MKREMSILEIRAILATLLQDWAILACNCDRSDGKHTYDCTVTLRKHQVTQVSRAIARLDEIAQKGL